MFKKTVIAAALAAVTGTALADVSVSGRVEQGFKDIDNDADGWAGYSDNQINFKASEDLGNGMTAFGQISWNADSTSAAGDALDQKVGLKGSFGTVVMGRMEDFTEGKLAATQSTMGTNGGELSGNAGRTSNAIAYVSPAVNGFTFGVAGYAINSSSYANLSDDLDATDVMVAYSNGPLTVMAAQEKLNKGAADVVAGASSGTATEEQTTTSVAVKYAMGDLSVAALHVDRENQAGSSAASADSKDLMVRLDYKMGANKITLQNADDESASNDINIVELSHSFSKRTAVYIGHESQDTANSDKTYFGIQHTF